ncbi:MAG: hypothetical protein ACR2QK_05875, partial [Acidimicrobiales bacterium]
MTDNTGDPNRTDPVVPDRRSVDETSRFPAPTDTTDQMPDSLRPSADPAPGNGAPSRFGPDALDRPTAGPSALHPGTAPSALAAAAADPSLPSIPAPAPAQNAAPAPAPTAAPAPAPAQN